jgi:hypothetical protein
MAQKPVTDDTSQAEPISSTDDLRARFLEALTKKQGKQKGVVSDRSGGKSGSMGASESHTQRMFQRKSGAS